MNRKNVKNWATSAESPYAGSVVLFCDCVHGQDSIGAWLVGAVGLLDSVEVDVLITDPACDSGGFLVEDTKLRNFAQTAIGVDVL
jgi:hypothetical protein